MKLKSGLLVFLYLLSVAFTQASLVQINLANNFLLNSPATLNSDLSGDGLADLTITNIQLSAIVDFPPGIAPLPSNIHLLTTFNLPQVDINGFTIKADFPNSSIATDSGEVISINPYDEFSELLSITFDATSIGYSATQEADVEIGIVGVEENRRIALTRLIFDDESATLPFYQLATLPSTPKVIGSVEAGVFTAIPEPSSSIILALGSLLCLKRRR